MDTKVSEILRMLDNYEGNEKEIFEMLEREVTARKALRKSIKKRGCSQLKTIVKNIGGKNMNSYSRRTFKPSNRKIIIFAN